MIELEKAAFLVDGRTELSAIKAKFQKEFGLNPVIRLVNCNGKHVRPEGYANAASGTLLMLLRSSCKYIIIILDKEKRKMGALKFAQLVKESVVETMASSGKFSKKDLALKIFVFVPDIMFENWIVADMEALKTHDFILKSKAKQKYYDGQNGSSILSRIMKNPYKKTLHAKMLFKSIRFDVANKYSPSFNRFVVELGLLD